jgi:uncharacterized protein (TIGR02246 family)
MKIVILFMCSGCLILSSCKQEIKQNVTSTASDSVQLINMVSVRETAMKNHDIKTVMNQFSEDATFINSAGHYFSNKTEINEFHLTLAKMDSFNYYYTAGKVKVRLLDNDNALVYYPWRMDWYSVLNPKDTLEKEVGLMTLSAQKRNNRWLWIAITNQHTPEYLRDLTGQRKIK